MTRNITLTMPEELIRRAKVLAAQRDTSVSALVARLLEQAIGDPRDDREVAEHERELMRSGVGYRIGSSTWTREDLHER